MGIHDDFFELGGHSLLVMRLLAQIEKEFGVRIPLTAIFQAPTIEQLARQIRSSMGSIDSGCKSGPCFPLGTALLLRNIWDGINQYTDCGQTEKLWLNTLRSRR